MRDWVRVTTFLLLFLQACAPSTFSPLTSVGTESPPTSQPAAPSPTPSLLNNDAPQSLMPTPTLLPTVTLVGEPDPPRNRLQRSASSDAPSPTLQVTQQPFASIQALSGYDSRFELRYDEDTWDLRPSEALLIHRSMPECQVYWFAGGRGAEGARLLTREIKRIGDYEVEIRAFWDIGLMTFSYDLPEGYYLFEVEFERGVPRRTMERCKVAVEKLLEGFRPLP